VVDPVFNTGCTAGCTVTTCSCTESSGYWSATTFSNFPDVVFGANFDDGVVFVGGTTDGSFVRAVRGGSGN
jgi:hypothetical protein